MHLGVAEQLVARGLPPQMSQHLFSSPPLPLLMARKVTELLKTFCESKRLTTDKVEVHGGAGLQPGVEWNFPWCREGPGLTLTFSTLSHLYFRPTSKTCPTS